MSKSKKQIETEIEQATERVVGKVTPSEKKELQKYAIDNDLDVQEVIREGVLNEIKKKILGCLHLKIILLVYLDTRR